MLDLFSSQSTAAITEALAAAPASGKLAVIGNARLAGALATAEREVLAVGVSARAARRLANVLEDLSSIDAGTLTGVVGGAIASDDAWERTLGDWKRVVRDGGVIVTVDRGLAVEASRRVLCAGLTELEQRRVGRLVITSGLVTHL